MPVVNSCSFIGHLGSDPEKRYDAKGRPIVNFRMAVSNRSKDRETNEWVDDSMWMRVTVFGQAGERRIAAENFFKGIYETDLSAKELLTAVEVPVARKDSAHFFFEFARRHGDYAIAGLAAQVGARLARLASTRAIHFAESLSDASSASRPIVLIVN